MHTFIGFAVVFLNIMTLIHFELGPAQKFWHPFRVGNQTNQDRQVQ